MANIDIDVAGLTADLAKLTKDKESFESQSKDFLNSISDKLDDSRGDFVDQIKRAMDNMHDTVAPKLVEEIDKCTAEIDAVIQSFEQVDQETAKALQGVR